MRRRVRSLASVGHRLGRGPRAVLGALAGAATALRPLAYVGRRLGRGPRAVLRALAGAATALRPLAYVGRRLGRGPRAVLGAVAGMATALGMAVGSSQGDADPPYRPTEPAHVGGARLVAWATSAGKPERRRHRPHRGGAAYYRRTARYRVPVKAASAFLPLYREAERRYGVNWRLLASIHRQETAFSRAPSTYHGLNPFGCCAGPMQFNVTNGPPSTWKLYRQAFRDGRRPKRYPHRTRSHPSVYDDFDAIMAAGWLLSDSGAGPSLDAGAWWAAYGYYGHDLFGVTYANQVLARAVAWQRDGFCPNCALDFGLVAEFEDAYGASVRQQLIAAERRRKRHKRRDDKGGRHDRRKGRDRGADDRARDRSHRQRRSRRRSGKKDGPNEPSRPRPRRRTTIAPSPPPPAPPQPSATPPTTTPAPPANCPPLRKLLGCKP